MRMPIALSFTSLSQYDENPQEFYLDRLCSVPRARHPQGKPAAAGSGFDARVKPALCRDVLGSVPPELEFETLFEKQVEKVYWDWSREASEYLFDAYVASGAYDDLRKLMERSEVTPRFEFEARRVVDGVPLVGRPDCYFKTGGFTVVPDWKVKGYCSTASPSRGYLLCRDGAGFSKPSRSHGKAYKNVESRELGGMLVTHFGLEGVKADYAAQLSIYGWLMGLEVGDEYFIGGIEELVCATPKAKRDTMKPKIRVALHRGQIGSAFQRDLLERFKACWEAIASGHVFRHLPREQSDELCSLLEASALARQVQHEDRDAERQLRAIKETYGVCA